MHDPNIHGGDEQEAHEIDDTGCGFLDMYIPEVHGDDVQGSEPLGLYIQEIHGNGQFTQSEDIDQPQEGDCTADESEENGDNQCGSECEEGNFDPVCSCCGLQSTLSSVEVALRRGVVSWWLTQHSDVLQLCFACKNNVQYIKNHTLSFYNGPDHVMYTSYEGADDPQPDLDESEVLWDMSPYNHTSHLLPRK